MKAAGPILTVCLMVLIITALVGIAWYSIMGTLETMERVVNIPPNKVSCSGTTATIEMKNMGNSVINNSDHNSMLGMFLDDPNIVARWGFDGEDGNVTKDSSGNRNHGSIYGDTVLLMHFDEGSGNPLDSTSYSNHGDISGHEPTWQPSGYCQSGRCLGFDGVDDYIDVSVTQSKDTISFWYRNSTEPSWTHIMNVSDILYVNGVLGSPLQYPVYISGNAVQIGKTGASAYFNGTIDEVAIYNRSLTGSEVMDMYEEGRARLIERKRPGRFGYGMELDGVDDRVEIVTDDYISPEATWSAWIKREPSATVEYFLGYGTPGSRFLVRADDGNLVFHDDILNESQTIPIAPNVFPAGEWHHVAIIFKSDGSKTAYVDGAFVGTDFDGSNPSSIGAGATFYIGAQINANNPFNGTIDEVIIWDRALTPGEIQAQIKPTCACVGMACSCGDLYISKTRGEGEFRPFFDSDAIPAGGSVTMTDYSCLSDTCSYRITSPGGSDEVFVDCV